MERQRDGETEDQNGGERRKGGKLGEHFSMQG
jgi:hypothetical protein